MRKITILLFSTAFAFVGLAQSGNTILDPINVDGVNVSVNVLNYQNSTASGMTPSCLGNNEDVYYRHIPSEGDTVVRIAMATAGLSFISTMEYQILKAPNGDINNIQQLNCDAYTTILLVGGSFEFLLTGNVSNTDEYYLRVFKPNSGVNLTTVLNNTLISMTSANTLSAEEANKDADMKIFVKDNYLNILNNKKLNKYEIYDITGKKVLKYSLVGDNKINIEYLPAGMYILKINSNENPISENIKFVKT